MANITAITRDGEHIAVVAHKGLSLMEALKAGGVTEVLALCGGCASCGTCHVYVAQDWVDRLQPIGEDEEEMLSLAPGRTDASRLSCQIPVTDEIDGLTVTVAPEA